jgi:hypothetical protein
VLSRPLQAQNLCTARTVIIRIKLPIKKQGRNKNKRIFIVFLHRESVRITAKQLYA